MLPWLPVPGLSIVLVFFYLYSFAFNFNPLQLISRLRTRRFHLQISDRYLIKLCAATSQEWAGSRIVAPALFVRQNPSTMLWNKTLPNTLATIEIKLSQWRITHKVWHHSSLPDGCNDNRRALNRSTGPHSCYKVAPISSHSSEKQTNK